MNQIKKLIRPYNLGVFIICSVLFQFGNATEGSESGGQCIWYGVCRNYEERDVEKSQYCSYNGTAKLLDSNGRNKLMTYCSFLDQGENNTFTCCDNDQIDIMNENIDRAAYILSGCPACFHNFLRPICEMTCSPKQSQFLKVQKMDDKDSKNGSYITSIDYFITYQYLNATFQSCKEVKFWMVKRSLDFMCGGAKGADCTPEKWYNFMGNMNSNNYVPFQTNYITEPIDGYAPFNQSTVPCNQAVNAMQGKCSCSDCSGSCNDRNWKFSIW